MNIFKSAAIASAFALTVAVPAQAAIVTVGGVTWDTESTSPITDFFASGPFDQWFQTSNAGIDDTDRVTVQFNNLNALIGTYLYGSGSVTEMNGVNLITGTPNPDTTPANFCVGCEVTFAFGGIELTGVNQTPLPGGNVFNEFTFDISNAWARIYVDSTPDWPQGSRPDADNAINGLLWLELEFASFSLTPSVNAVGGSVSAQFYAVGGLALPYFDTNPTQVRETLMLPGADLTYTSSSQFANGANYSSGTGEIAGDTKAVPEPATIALLGGALLGLAVTRRRRS